MDGWMDGQTVCLEWNELSFHAKINEISVYEDIKEHIRTKSNQSERWHYLILTM